MRRSLKAALSAVVVAAPMALVATQFGASAAAPTAHHYPPHKAAIKAGAHIEGYIGHDEPATLFYSNTPGSGNNVTYQMTLPKDPPTLPRNNGSGGTDSFQLHPTFWLGMVMCDSQGS